jgi:hypothetical protein
MSGGSDGCRAALILGHLTPGLSSFGLPPFIAFSTSYPELDSAATTCFARARKASQRELNLYFFVVSFVPATGST